MLFLNSYFHQIQNGNTNEEMACFSSSSTVYRDIIAGHKIVYNNLTILLYFMMLILNVLFSNII